MGEHRVKNIAEPVTVYRVITEPSAPRPGTRPQAHEGMSRWRRGVLGAIAALQLLLTDGEAAKGMSLG